VARVRSVQHVVVDAGTARGARRMIEGETGTDVQRRLRGAAEVIVIPPA
jgi:hypothetical protein